MTIYGVVGNQHGWNEITVLSRLADIITNKEDRIISGGAVGVDTYAQDFARGFGITITIHYPDDDKPSPERYFERNKQIAEECEILIAFDKKSGRAGTKNTVAYAKKAGKKVILFTDEKSLYKYPSCTSPIGTYCKKHGVTHRTGDII